MNKEAAMQEYQEALGNHQSSYNVLLSKKQALDEYVLEEEVEKQAIFFNISEDEARSRIEQNRQERAEGRPRTIWTVS